MSFKIVQTIEDGKPKLSVVPTLWETKGFVHWPPKNLKFGSKFIKDPNSRPRQGWDLYKCVLKRNFISSYEEANNELRKMEQNTDTDYETDQCSGSVPQNSKHNLPNDEINFDAMAQDLADLNNSPSSANDNRTAANVFCQQQDSIQVFNSEDIQTVIANQGVILEKLNIVVDNQKKITHKLASLSIQLDETKASISQEIERPVNVTLLHDQLSTEETESFCITPIENQQQLDMFEMKLADKAQKKKIFKTLSLLFSSSVGSGITCAYKVLDVIFSRDFLCQCSWSGGSKGENSKIAFKNYKNFRKFLFEIVNSWDSQFTDDAAEKFLKLVVRNATKRKTMKGLRQSSKRIRKRGNRGNDVKRGEKLPDNASNDNKQLQANDEDNVNNRETSQSGHNESNGHNSEEPRAGDESNGINGEEPQAGKAREQPEVGDNYESSDEKMDLC